MIAITSSMLAAVSYGWTHVAITAAMSTALIACVHWRAGRLGTKYRVSGVLWDSEGQWWVMFSERGPLAARLCAESVAQRMGAWLVFKTEQGSKYFVLVHARHEPELYRRLLVRLRVRGPRLPVMAVQPLSDPAHVYAHLPLENANFRRARRSIEALKELPWPRTTRGETRRP
jgi:hypothetical protein